LSNTTIKVLQDKLKEFKNKHPNNKSITLNDLKAVYRRGSGAYSTSHRPNITRAAWSYARVNKFLEKASGNKVKKAYVQDDDLLKYEDGGVINLAPNGKPSNLTLEQYKLVRTPSFKRWFGDWENDTKNASKVVDDNGEPLVVYHGTENQFNVFKEKGKGNRVLGYFFTDDRDFSENYGETKLYFLSIKNIKIYSAKKFDETNTKENMNNGYWDLEKQKLLENSYNGILINRNDFFAGFNIIRKDFVAFEPNQIKLADGTNTTFDPKNSDIRYKKGGEMKTYWYKGLFKTNYFPNAKILEKGGVVVGKSHQEADLNGTGEKFKVASTNEIVELEGGEGVIVSKALNSREKHSFDGSKKTPREIASFLNHKYGGVKFEKGGEVTCGCSKKKYYHGGELPSAVVDKLEGGEAVITKKTMQSKQKYEYEGRMLTPRQILSDINYKFGGRKF